MTDLWVEKYRPKTFADYVWRDEEQKNIVKSWINEGIIPSLIFSGTQGSGKTSLIHMILNELNVEPGDILEINASEKTSVEVIRNDVLRFSSTIPWGKFKVCILEEFDAMSKEAQNSLKRVIEENSDYTRFIFTSNNPHKIDPAIHSRCQGFHIESLDEEQYLLKLAEILVDNEVDFDPDILISYVEATIPDLRKGISLIQMNSKSGTLLPPNSDSKAKLEYMAVVSELFKKGQIQQAREVIVSEASPEDYTEIFRYLYRNMDFWGKTQDVQDEALLIIRDGMVKDGMVADREINLAATLVQLKNLSK